MLYLGFRGHLHYRLYYTSFESLILTHLAGYIYILLVFKFASDSKEFTDPCFWPSAICFSFSWLKTKVIFAHATTIHFSIIQIYMLRWSHLCSNSFFLFFPSYIITSLHIWDLDQNFQSCNFFHLYFDNIYEFFAQNFNRHFLASHRQCQGLKTKFSVVAQYSPVLATMYMKINNKFEGTKFRSVCNIFSLQRIHLSCIFRNLLY